jgi:phage terminase large subunit-like protein
VHPADFRPTYELSKRRLTWPNGAIATLYNAVEPDQLRGPQHDAAWCDELAKWMYAQDTWDQLQFGLRLGDNPQTCITTTPRPILLLKNIMKDPGTVITRGSTLNNAANLATKFLERIVARYQGTRLGRQELDAEILEDLEGALWRRLRSQPPRSMIGSPKPAHDSETACPAPLLLRTAMGQEWPNTNRSLGSKRSTGGWAGKCQERTLVD